MTNSTAIATQPPGTITGLWHRLKANKLAHNFSKMGAAQLIIRISRLLATILLSRLLLPQDYGVAAVVLTAYEFIALFTRNGISAKVIKADADKVMVVAMTAYHMTWVVCAVLMAVQVAVAWPIAWFYGDTRLALPIAAMALVYLATPVSNIQGAFQVREGHMGRIAFAGAAQVIADNILTAVLAVMGLGLWAIILPKILVAPVWAIPVRLGHAWRPKRIDGVSAFEGWRPIAKFSRHVMGVELLTTMQANMDNLIVGYFLGLQALGLYYFAFNAGLGISLGFTTAIASATFPHLCEVRDNGNAFMGRIKSAMKLAAVTLVPMILLQAGLAKFYVPIVFGNKWDDAIPVLALICLSALVRPFSAIISQSLRALSKTEIELKWQLANTALLGLALLISAQFNILSVAFAVLAVQTLMLSAFVYYSLKYLKSTVLNIKPATTP